MKRIVSLVLTLALALSLSAPMSVHAAAFTDVPSGRWSYDYIARAVADGVVQGVGDGKFDPTGTLTYAHFYTILTRAFYADNVASTPEGKMWYSKYTSVAIHHSLDVGVAGDYSSPMPRQSMAIIISNLLADQGFTALSKSEADAVASRIPDWSTVDENRAGNAVAWVYSLGVITGMDDGSFAPNSTMTREQCAAVYCRIKDVIDNKPQPQPEPKVELSPEEVDPVGTFSDGEAKLSAKTHAPVVDYWSMQSSEIQSLTDRDAFNAAVQTLHDAKMLRDHGNIEVDLRTGNVFDKTYNYAMYQHYELHQEPADVDKVERALLGLSNYGMLFGSHNYVDGRIVTAGYARYDDCVDSVFNPIFAQFPSDCSDMTKVNICQQAICDRFDYDWYVLDTQLRDTTNDPTQGVFPPEEYEYFSAHRATSDNIKIQHALVEAAWG